MRRFSRSGSFATAFSFRLTARDVDSDHDLDIVLTAGLSDQLLAVWINDGRGGFSEGDPAAYPELIRIEELSFRAQTSRILRKLSTF